MQLPREMKELKLVMRFLIAPASSWEAELHEARKPAVHENSWFYPSLAVVALTSFVQMFWGASLTAALVRAIAQFCAFFFGYMACPMILSVLIKSLGSPKAKEVKESSLKIFVMFVYSMGLIVALLQNVLPAPLIPLYIFLAYVLVILSRCAHLFGAESDWGKLKFVFGAFCILLIVPLAILLIITYFIPEEAL